MINICNNISFKAIAWLFLTHYPLPMMQSIKKPLSQNYFHKLNGLCYTDNCAFIDKIQTMQCAALIAYYRLTNRKSHLSKVMDHIKKEITEFETTLLVLEQEALNAIKKKYQMSDIVWSRCLYDIQQTKQSYITGMTQKYTTVIHDEKIPHNIFEILITLLKKNNINPDSVHLHMISDQEEIEANPSHIAYTKSFINVLPENGIEKDLNISHDYIPAEIKLFPRITNCQLTTEIASKCAHEIQHLVQQHALSELIITEYLYYYYGIDAVEFKKSSEYQRLSCIHEAQAEIFSATKDAYIAECFKVMRLKSYYPDHLYEEHFFHISTIAMLWKVYAWLEYFY
ncbi:MAG TPA: hypothetical protein VLB80_05210 [Candidatus Babeliales bacterium]|nr:hypothetical protein [Candidatus Babeliales bacterium]